MSTPASRGCCAPATSDDKTRVVWTAEHDRTADHNIQSVDEDGDRAPIWAHVIEAIAQADESKRRIRESHLKLAASFGVDPTADLDVLPDPTFGEQTADQ
jgi:hypothetical protein